MNWKTIRLELGPTTEFPRGSASRAFLLRAPIDEDGQIDAQSIARNPMYATVRRYWASERDESGHLERANGSWVFRPTGKDADGKSYNFSVGEFRPNGQIIIRQGDGVEFPFRIVSMKSLGGVSTPKA